MVAQEEDRDLTPSDSDLIVNTDLRYPICIGDDTRAAIASFLEHRAQPFVVLADANPCVLKLARDIAQRSKARGIVPIRLGESRKRFSTMEAVHEALLAMGTDRGTLVLGVGGGVASDLFGFAAATYMRGVPYAHVATTLVAMADAAVGGKTGVDLRGGKNLAGVFRDPIAVFAQTSALRSLPYRSLREGLAEVLKAAIIEGNEFYEAIETLSPHPFWRWPWLEIVAQAIKVKTMVVVDDREEAGMRELLNLGHTFGHAFEAASKFRITHGAGVALGLRAAGILAMKTGRFSHAEHLRVLGTMALLGMPLRTTVEPEAAFAAMASDKKKRDGRLRFVVPRAIGDVEYGVNASERQIKSTLSALRQPPGPIG